MVVKADIGLFDGVRTVILGKLMTKQPLRDLTR